MLVSLVSPAPKWAADRRAGSKSCGFNSMSRFHKRIFWNAASLCIYTCIGDVPVAQQAVLRQS